MNHRSYSLLETPFDLHATLDELVRNYEIVRQNINEIMPNLSSSCGLAIIADGTPHNAEEVPLLGLYCLDGATADCPAPKFVQNEIDNWFATTPPDTMQQLVTNTAVPTWAEILAFGTYPNDQSESS